MLVFYKRNTILPNLIYINIIYYIYNLKKKKNLGGAMAPYTITKLRRWKYRRRCGLISSTNIRDI